MSLATGFSGGFVIDGRRQFNSAIIEAADRITSCVSLGLDIGILHWDWSGVVAATTTAPPWPCSRGAGSRDAPHVRNGHSTALFTDECQSFPKKYYCWFGADWGLKWLAAARWSQARGGVTDQRSAMLGARRKCEVLCA